jgi:MEMO1 family protein
MATAQHHPLVELARKTIETYVTERKQIAPPADLPHEFQGRAGVFVSLHADGELRGCIGTIESSQPSIGHEVINNAIMAATEDPRFPPVAAHEVAGLEISVDVLTKPERIASPAELDPKRYGVIVQNGFRRGLLLPDLEGVDTADCQIDIARRKAGIGRREPLQLSRFEVHRYC